VLAVSEHDGELEQAIETTADLVDCPGCGAVAQLHDRRPCWVRDLPTGGRPVTLVWIKRVWRCPHRLCPIRTWTETCPQILPRASLTERARAEVCRRVGEDGASVAAVARDFGVGWGTAMAAVRAHGTPRVDARERLDGVAVLGVDETAFQAASATRSTSFVTGIVDLTRRDRPARLLDVVADRSASGLLRWMVPGRRSRAAAPGAQRACSFQRMALVKVLLLWVSRRSRPVFHGTGVAHPGAVPAASASSPGRRRFNAEKTIGFDGLDCATANWRVVCEGQGDAHRGRVWVGRGHPLARAAATRLVGRHVGSFHRQRRAGDQPHRGQGQDEPEPSARGH
jgi:transposase-like protein